MAHYSDLDAGIAGASYSAPVVPAASAGAYEIFFKRVLDILLVLLAAPFVVPVVLGLGLIVRRDGGAAFYCQPRIGRGGKVFRLWKLRSMVVDADRKLEAYLCGNPLARAEWDETQKLKEDPRITAAGRLIRKTSLDELPQLWNVLRGEMSLVGPRPAPPREVSEYDLWHRRRLSMKPGITGLWQVTARRSGDFDDRAQLDLSYIDRWSLWLDLKILARTVPAALEGR